ncbi:MAG: MBL fold metallo-hydrolase [Chloroflexi bacterium]|nr:MBL fold metallo-hydrolase [Chloroflexota bacterium]
MKLTWYGHAAFGITAADGTMIITDPYTPETAGYPPIQAKPTVVITSSDNDSYHCRADLIPGNPTVINALELARSGAPRTENGITFHAIEAMEALNHRYHDPDQNGMYRFEVDGVSIGHMGDVGNPLSDAQVAFFQDVDVLLALTGGHPTIELDDLKVVIDRARPRLVVPMHFQTLTYKPHNILWIEQFLRYFPPEAVELALSSEIELLAGQFAQPTRVLVMDYVRPC